MFGEESFEGLVRADRQGTAFVGAGDEPKQQSYVPVSFESPPWVDLIILDDLGFAPARNLSDGVVGQVAAERLHEGGGGEVVDLVPGVDRGGSLGRSECGTFRCPRVR